jgi:hypothetical protein
MKIIWPVVGMLVTLSILALPIAFWLIRRSALKQEPLTDGGALEFPITRGMRFLIDSVVIALIGFSVLILGTALIQGEGWYAVFMPLAVLLAILMATPGAVVLDHAGIRQHRWLLGDKTIAWNEIAWMRHGWRTGAIYVKSKNGGAQLRSPLSTLADLTLNGRLGNMLKS